MHKTQWGKERRKYTRKFYFQNHRFFFLYNANMLWEFPLASLPLSPLADQGQSVLSYIFVLRLIWHMIPSCNLHPVRNLERSSPPDSEVIIPCHVTLTGLANSVKQNSWSSLCTLSLINKAFLVERVGGQVGRERRQKNACCRDSEHSINGLILRSSNDCFSIFIFASCTNNLKCCTRNVFVWGSYSAVLPVYKGHSSSSHR